MLNLAALKLVIKHKDTVPLFVELVEEIQRAKRADGTIARRNRSQLMAHFWALAKAVQAG